MCQEHFTFLAISSGGFRVGGGGGGGRKSPPKFGSIIYCTRMLKNKIARIARESV